MLLLEQENFLSTLDLHGRQSDRIQFSFPQGFTFTSSDLSVTPTPSVTLTLVVQTALRPFSASLILRDNCPSWVLGTVMVVITFLRSGLLYSVCQF